MLLCLFISAQMLAQEPTGQIGSHSVVQLPTAAHQPRAGTKLLVDLTSGSDAKQVNAGLEKVAKYLNIYASGGAVPAQVQIAVVFHGEATLAVLNAKAYAAKFNTDGNPNLKLLEELRKSNVDLYVCGQSLISKGSSPEEVVEVVHTAVSALTAVVNLQADGYAYVPLAHVAPAAVATSHAVAEEDAENISVEDHNHGPQPGSGTGSGTGNKHKE